MKKMEDRFVVVMVFLLCRAALIHDQKKSPTTMIFGQY